MPTIGRFEATLPLTLLPPKGQEKEVPGPFPLKNKV